MDDDDVEMGAARPYKISLRRRFAQVLASKI